MGTLGEAFETAPKPDQQKLLRVEQAKLEFESLESEELKEKFAKAKGRGLSDQLAYVSLRFQKVLLTV